MAQHRNNSGFILPLSILLVVILAISGAAFMQHDFLERRTTMTNVDNHAAFYLANAGIERARAVFKVGQVGTTPSWTPILNDPTPTPAESSVHENPPNPVLCADPDPSKPPRDPCLIPSFGTQVSAQPSNPPFDTMFNRGQYAVRAFNNPDDPSGKQNEDGDQRLTFRALGVVGGEQKLLEATVVATAGLRLINCDDRFGQDCPKGSKEPLDYQLGRDPKAFPLSKLPTFDRTHYEHHQLSTLPPSWGLTDIKELPGPVVFKPGNLPMLKTKTYYFINGNVTMDDSINQIVVFATGTVTVNSFVSNKSILIGLGGITLNPGSGSVILKSQAPYPVLISGSGLTINKGSAIIRGNIWSDGPVNFLKVQLIQGITTAINGPITIGPELVGKITDRDLDTPPSESLEFYIPMPGFNYPSGLVTPGLVSGAWRELQ